jgi:putative hydrolase of HD superfamily
MQSVIDFVLELDKLKTVTRKTKTLHSDRYENSAEHSWQIAMLAWSLAPYAPADTDINQVIKLLLVHDIGEIDTGDTIVYANADWDALKAEELAAAQRIFGLLPAGASAELLALWQEFEDGETVEAQFAHACDRAMPVLLNLANNGQSWRENGISYQRVVARIEAPISQGCPALWQYLSGQLTAAQQAGWFGSEDAIKM